jgi:hypothetical protein
MVFVQTKTNITLNNTVQQVCANLDSLVSAVVGAMQETYGVPFSGNVSAINNQIVRTACSRRLVRRRLLGSQNTNNNNATISTQSLEQISERKLANTTTTTTNTAIQTRLNADSNLVATAVDTSVAASTPPPPKTLEIAVIITYTVIVACCVVLGVLGWMIYYYAWQRGTTTSSRIQTTAPTGQTAMPYQPAQGVYVLMPRIDMKRTVIENKG